MNSFSRCILGQRCPLEVLARYVGAAPGPRPARPVPLPADRAYEAYAVKLSGLTPQELGEWAVEHGFAAEDDDDDEYEALTAEWCRVIEARRAAPAGD